jgi:hypothetical protein
MSSVEPLLKVIAGFPVLLMSASQVGPLTFVPAFANSPGLADEDSNNMQTGLDPAPAVAVTVMPRVLVPVTDPNTIGIV